MIVKVTVNLIPNMTTFLGSGMIIIGWLVFWAAAWRVFYGPLSRRRVDYTNRYGLTAAYFLVLAGITVILFHNTVPPIRDILTRLSAVVLAFMICLHVSVYYLSRRFLRKPRAMIERHPQEFFLTFDYRYLFSKTFEVLFQQIMIAVLVLTIARMTGNIVHIILIYAFIFSTAHIPMMKMFGDQAQSFAWFYVASAIASSLIFPPLIIKVNGGLVYAYVIHSFFYTLLALVIWGANTLDRSD